MRAGLFISCQQKKSRIDVKLERLGNKIYHGFLFALSQTVLYGRRQLSCRRNIQDVPCRGPHEATYQQPRCRRQIVCPHSSLYKDASQNDSLTFLYIGSKNQATLQFPNCSKCELIHIYCFKPLSFLGIF